MASTSRPKGRTSILAAVCQALGLPRGTLEGTLRVSANVTTTREGAKGHVRLGLRKGTLGPLGGASLGVSADVDGRALTGSASGLVEGLGGFGATWDTTLDGPPLDLASYEKATGTAEVQVGDVRLALASAALPKSSPIDHLGGHLYARIRLDRDSNQVRIPTITTTVSTDGLALGIAGSNDRIKGIDIVSTDTLDGKSGELSVNARATDTMGDLVETAGSIRLDLDQALREPATALARLLETPLDATVTLPRRQIATWPARVRPDGLTGALGASVRVSGTLHHPTIAGKADLFQLSTNGGFRPVDLHAEGQYEWATRALTLHAAASAAGRQVATGEFLGSVPNGIASWDGRGRIALEDAPLDLLLGMHHMNGGLFGQVNWSRTKDGTGDLGGDIRISNMVTAHESLGTGRILAETTGDVLQASVEFKGGQGTLSLHGTAPLSFQTPFPTLAHDAPIIAKLVTHDFSATALAPFVAGVLTRIDGHVDANVGAEFHPRTDRAGLAWAGGLTGTAAIKDGNVLVDALGLEVRDLSCSVAASAANGATNIAVRDLRGKVRSSKDNLQASADLILQGVELARGTVNLDAKDLPILFRGAPQGRITGKASAKLTRQSDRMLVDIDVPALVANLPQTSTRQVIALGDNPDVSIVQFETPATSENDVMPWRLTINLGNNVSIRRSDVELGISGTPVIELGNKLAMSGSIDLGSGGRVPVLGKVFIVDHGEVFFDTPDPGDPRLDVSASWRAPDDTTVYVDVTGTMQAPNIAVRSDPPLSEAEVYALILGGTNPDSGGTALDASNSGNQSAAAGATALGGSVAAMGVNQLLTNNPLELRVDTTSQSLPRYTAAVRVRENLWFEASEYQQTEYSEGAASDRAVVSGTVDYRFTKRWSLRTEVGTAGGSLDLLWQYRY